MGATHTINRRETEDLAKEIERITGKGARYILDTTGNQDMIENVIGALGPRGMFAGIASIPGGPTAKLRIPYNRMSPRSNSVAQISYGNGNPHKVIPEMVGHFKSGELPLDKIITFYDFEDMEKAWADHHEGITLKPVLLPNK